MAKKKIVSIGFELASNDIEFCDFDSDRSLLDWDIILFRPQLRSFLDHFEMYNGKPCLSDYKSFRLKERTNHWRREIRDVIEAGKTVFVFLSKITEVFIATGEKTHSGTGRNQKTTRVVTEFNSYMSIPVTLGAVNREGSSIKLAPKNSDLIASYWAEFGEKSKYKVVLEEGTIKPFLLTKNGDKTVGAIIKAKTSKGAIILLPDIDFYPTDFIEELEDEDGVKDCWTDKALQFSSKLIKSIVSINTAIMHDADFTPEPDWASINSYALSKEASLKSKLLKIEGKIEALQLQKGNFIQNLAEASKLRGLLYEGGKALEAAIIDSLKILGFKATNYEDDNSEFDAVFESKDGRLIGEAEGKNNKAINITKLRQLALNIHEDLEREGVGTPAKGVLFGNAYKLTPVEDRDDPFTEKCKTAAKTTSTALVFTPDLFTVVRYLSNYKDASFAKKCRVAIANTIGRVTFPEIPEKGREKEENEEL